MEFIKPPPPPILVQLQNLNDAFHAQAMRSYLESYGIPCFLEGYNHSSIAWHYQQAIGIKVMVPLSDYEYALKLLERAEENAPKAPDIKEKRVFVEKNPLKNLTSLILSAFTGLPFVWPKKLPKEEGPHDNHTGHSD